MSDSPPPPVVAKLTSGSRRVAVVDDDDISRRGVFAILDDCAGIDVLVVADHDEALAEVHTWPQVDLLLIDAADTRRDDDHFIGVEVVRRFRQNPAQAGAAVVVVTGHFLADALRTRMGEADADIFLHRSAVQDEVHLIEVVRDPSSAVPGVPTPADPEALFRLGINPSSRVNAAVAHHHAHGWTTDDDLPVGKRSRVNITLRRRFQELARLHVVNADGRPPERQQDLPSRPQIERFLEWATRSDRGDVEDRRGPGRRA